MAVHIHGNGNRAVAQLLLNVARALVGHQQQGGIGVAQIVRVAHPQAGCSAYPFDQRLHLPLAVRPASVLFGVDEQVVDPVACTGM